MSQIVICPGVSWAALHESSQTWLPAEASHTLVLTPPQWKTSRVQPWFPTCSVATTVELLERYLEAKFQQQCLLEKSAITHLLNAIIYQSTGEEQAASARFLNIETSYPGYVRALTEFIINFRENGPESLLAALSALKSGPLSARERDLIDIHAELENALERRNLFDYRRALLTFVKDDGIPQIFPPGHENGTLVIFGFSHLTELESKLLDCLLRRCERVVLAVCRNASAAEPVFRLQTSLEKFIQQYVPQAEEVKVKRTKAAIPQKLAERIFQDDKSGLLLQAESAVRITEANSRFAEVTNLARQMRWLHDEGVPYERMRAIFPAYEVYAALLLEVFPAYGIPYRASAGAPLTFYPLAQLVLNLLNHALAPSPFALREAIFSSPYVTFSCEVRPEALLEFVDGIEAGLLSRGKISAAQLRPLDFGFLQTLKRRAAQAVRAGEILHPLQLIARHLHILHYDQPQELQRMLIEVAAGFFVLARAEKALYVWRSAMSPVEFCEAVEKLLARFHIEENLRSLHARGDTVASGIITRDRQVLGHLRHLLTALQEQFSTVGGHAAKFPLADLIQAFAAMTRDPEHYLPEEKSSGVFVCTPQAAPLGPWEATFLAGLVDGNFPEQPPFNFLQPKSEGGALAGDLVWVDRDRQALYQILASTSGRVFFSYPISEGNKKLLVSPFVTEIQKCLAAAPASENENGQQLYTAREKLIFIGQKLDRALEAAVPVLREFKRSTPDLFAQIIAVLQCDGLRASVSSFSRFDGLIGASSALAAIAEQLRHEGVIAISQLERFAGCPLRFLFDDLVHLKPDFLIDYHPDATERGLMMRKILTDYSRALASSGKITENAAGMLHETAVAALAGLVTEKDNLFSRRFKNGLLTGLQPDEGEKQRRPGVLAAFLEFDKTAPDLLSPHLADLHFEPGEAKALRLEGVPFDIPVAIARVEVTNDGRHLIIFNYSVADLGDVEKIGKGLRFDLPLQILALRQSLPAKDKKKNVAGAGVYLVKSHREIKRGGYFALKDLQATRRENVSEETPIFSGQRKYGFLPAANFEQELQNVVQRVAHIVDLIHRGRFHLPICSMKDQICPNCHFARICRIEQLRVDKLYTQVDEEETYKPLRRVE